MKSYGKEYVIKSKNKLGNFFNFWFYINYYCSLCQMTQKQDTGFKTEFTLQY